MPKVTFQAEFVISSSWTFRRDEQGDQRSAPRLWRDAIF
jgi:hypothetical protein